MRYNSLFDLNKKKRTERALYSFRKEGVSVKKILLFSRDPGGANAIIPLVLKLKERNKVFLYGKDVALQRYQTHNLKAKNIMDFCQEITIEEIEHFLEELQPDLIVTGTSADDNTEKYLWKAGERLGIASIAILDQWVNYGIRFSKYFVSEIQEYQRERTQDYLPTKILVMDAFAKKEMQKEGIKEEKIIVTGQPYFDVFMEQLKNISNKTIKEYRESLGCREEDFMFVYASEPISKIYGSEQGKAYWGYTEKTIFTSLQRELVSLTKQYGKQGKVIIRPHPKENKEAWSACLGTIENVTFQLDDSTDAKLLIKASDLICGMSSMFLMESALCDKKILSVQIGLKKENPFILDKKGIIKSVRTEQELKEQLQFFLEGKMQQYELDIKYGAIEKVIQEIERE